MSARVLLVESEPAARGAAAARLAEAGFEVAEASSAAEALDLASHLPADVVVLGTDPRTSRDTALLAGLEAGGAVCVRAAPADLVALVAQAADTARLRRAVAALAARDPAGTIAALLGTSETMRALGEELLAVAASDRTTVLLVGEPGTGKGRIARALHDGSGRADAPFVTIACGAQDVGEDGLRDALESARGGTVFLDDVGRLPLERQPRLLGAMDARLLAATSLDLVEAVDAGRFREDLYYRISVAVIRVPPLRARTVEDRQAVLEAAYRDLARGLPDAPTTIAREAMDRLLQWPWSGNVREMRNVLEGAMMQSRGETILRAERLPDRVRRGAAGHDPVSLRSAERRVVAAALRHHAGNRTRAARELGISRVTLLKKIRDYGLDEGRTG